MLTWTETKLKPLDPGSKATGIRLRADHGETYIGHAIWFPGRLWRVTLGPMGVASGDFQTREQAVAAIEFFAGRWRTK